MGFGSSPRVNHFHQPRLETSPRPRSFRASKDPQHLDPAPPRSRSVNGPTISARFMPEMAFARSTDVFHVKRWRVTIDASSDLDGADISTTNP